MLVSGVEVGEREKERVEGEVEAGVGRVLAAVIELTTGIRERWTVDLALETAKLTT
jgi:hypothetical protein